MKHLMAVFTLIGLTASAAAMEQSRSLQGTWKGGPSLFEEVTFTSTEVPGSTGMTTYRFSGVLTAQFCQRSKIPCPADRKVEGEYTQTTPVDTAQGSTARLQLTTRPDIFGPPNYVGQLFQETVAPDGATMTLAPRYDYQRMLEPRLMTFTRAR